MENAMSLKRLTFGLYVALFSVSAVAGDIVDVKGGRLDPSSGAITFDKVVAAEAFYQIDTASAGDPGQVLDVEGTLRVRSITAPGFRQLGKDYVCPPDAVCLKEVYAVEYHEISH
jgi:hypothetical protein